MVTVIHVARLAVIACLWVLGSCSCSKGSNGDVQGILGEGVSLNCVSKLCGSKKWRNDSMGETSPYIESARRTNNDGVSYELHLFNMSVYAAGSYSCWCKENNDAPYFICSDTLELICQAKVVVNNASKLYNSSRTDSFPQVIIHANVKDRLKVKCPEGAVPNTNCYNVMKREMSDFMSSEINVRQRHINSSFKKKARGSDHFTYNFKVSWEHHSCIITCQAKKGNVYVCSITFIIKLSGNETSTHISTVSSTVLTVSPVNEIALTNVSSENATLEQAYTTMKVDDKKDNNINPVTDKSASFSVIIGVCILVFTVVIVTFVISVCIFSLNSKSRSQSTQNVNVFNPPTNANIPIGQTYETVNEPSNGFLKGDDSLKEPEVLSTDGFYSEVSGAGEEVSTTHQPNSRIAETSVTNDYYSKVITSDFKLKTTENGQETDSTIYSEENNGEKQPRRKQGTSSLQRSGDDKSVSNAHIYHVLEVSKGSDHDTVDDASNSQVLYAVADKDT